MESNNRSTFSLVFFFVSSFEVKLFRHREYTSNSEEPVDTNNSESEMSRRMIVPPESMNQHHYVPPSPAQSFNYARQQPSAPKKHIQHDADMFDFFFRPLNSAKLRSISLFHLE